MSIVTAAKSKLNSILNRDMAQKQSKNSNIASSNHKGYVYNHLFGRDTNNLSYHTYKNIMKDTQVKVGLEILKYFLISKNYRLTSNSDDPEDVEITEFITEVLDNMEIPFRDVLKNMLTAIAYGYSVQEKVYAINKDGRIVIKAFYPVHVKTLQNRPFTRDKNGELISIHQETNSNGSADLPVDKCLIYSFDKEFDEIEGNSILNEIKPIVEDKEDCMDWLMTFASKNKAPTMVGKTDDTLSGDNMLNAFDDIADGKTGMIIGQEDDVSLLESSHNGETYFELLNYADNKIFRRMFIGTLLLGNQSQTGSYAQANVQQDFMMYIMDGILADAATEIQSTLNDLVKWNFGVDAKAPNFSFESFNSKDILGLLAALQPFVANGSLDSEEHAFKELLQKAFQSEADIKMDIEEPGNNIEDETNFDYQEPLDGTPGVGDVVNDVLEGIV